MTRRSRTVQPALNQDEHDAAQPHGLAQQGEAVRVQQHALHGAPDVEALRQVRHEPFQLPLAVMHGVEERVARLDARAVVHGELALQLQQVRRVGGGAGGVRGRRGRGRRQGEAHLPLLGVVVVEVREVEQERRVPQRLLRQGGARRSGRRQGPPLMPPWMIHLSVRKEEMPRLAC
jgi:hypothetical protein